MSVRTTIIICIWLPWVVPYLDVKLYDLGDTLKVVVRRNNDCSMALRCRRNPEIIIRDTK